MGERKCLVVSAVNFTEGGPLTVLEDSLNAAAQFLSPQWEIIALVHDGKLIQNNRVRCLEFPHAKRSWIKRLMLEWIYFKKLSSKLKPDLWLSLHDVTPRVRARCQAVYCHNPSPFYQISLREAWLEPKLLLFNLLYARLYSIYIKRNKFVIVQQQWLRAEFQRRFGCHSVIVAHPACHIAVQSENTGAQVGIGKTVFLYPALPRVFKNYEDVCEAVAILPSNIQAQVEVRLTLDGTENIYARSLMRRYGQLPGLRFIGRQSRRDMARHYAECDVVLFPSKLETWGLPITEAKAFGKSLLVADLPYSRETVGSYKKVSFLPLGAPESWAKAILKITNGTWKHSGNDIKLPTAPYAGDWSELWKLLTQEL